MAGDLVGGSFDAVGVVSGAFDHALAGAVSALAEAVAQDFVDGLVYGFGQAFRGKWPPGR
jgi:hypothetical protein